MQNKKVGGLTIAIALLITLVVAVIWAMSVGAVSIPVSEVIDIIMGRVDTVHKEILLGIRLPRVILALIVGIGLATTGAAMQGIFRNPLVDAYTLGMLSGASLGAVIATVTGISIKIFGFTSIGIFAFIGAAISLAIVYALAATKNKVTMNSLLLAGVAISYFINALISFLMLINKDKIDNIFFWTMGSLSFATWEKVIMTSVLVLPCIFILMMFSKELNIMNMGEESAIHLGVNTALIKNIILVLSALIVGAVVAASGTIGFIGLVSPHIARLMLGSDNKHIIPSSAIIGAIILIASDALGRTLLAPAEIPVGVMTAMIGCPFFIYLLKKQKK